MSKPSAAENQYFRVIGERMEVGELRCVLYPYRVTVGRYHPRGPSWETGTGLKAQHHWFILPVSKRAHDEYHSDAVDFEATFSTHAEALTRFWGRSSFRTRFFHDDWDGNEAGRMVYESTEEIARSRLECCLDVRRFYLLRFVPLRTK